MRGVFVGATAVRANLAAFAALGLDASCIQGEAGFSPDELADPDGRIPSARMYRMWEVAESLWQRRGLGLEAGAVVPIGAYEVLDYLVSTASTLGEGLSDFANYFALATRTARYEIRSEGVHVACEMVWRIPAEGVMFHLRDYSLAALAHRVREASGVAPLNVELKGPPLAAQDRYRQLFGAQTMFRASRNALVFAAAALQAPVARRDAVLHRTLRRHADLLLERTGPADDERAAARVRDQLLRRARLGVPRLEEIAHALGVGARTLQRQLREEGVTFAALACDVRASLAREYLADPSVTIGEIAYLVGFSEPSAFSRAFRSWTGTSPVAVRARHVTREGRHHRR